MYGAVQTKPFVFVYEQHDIEVVYGPSCRRGDEIRLDRCEADGIPVVERRNGGGTVVLGPGMVITIIIGERNGTIPATAYFTTIHDAMNNRGMIGKWNAIWQRLPSPKYATASSGH